MYDQLDSYDPPPIGPLPPPVQPSMWDRLMRSRFFRDMADELHQANTATIPLPPPPPGLPKGLYLFGSVGCGKSFLMDLLYAHLPDKYRRSASEGGFGARRVHFHQFMMDVHKKGHLIKLRDGAAQDWIVMAAREIAGETRVLCFDEFQVRPSSLHVGVRAAARLPASSGHGLADPPLPPAGDRHRRRHDPAPPHGSSARTRCRLRHDVQVRPLPLVVVVEEVPFADARASPAAERPTSSTRTASSASSSCPASSSSRAASSCTASIRTSVRPLSRSSLLVRLDLELPLTPAPPRLADYRKRPRELSRVYFSPITDATKHEFAKLFRAACEHLSPGEAVTTDRQLSVWGRPVHVPHSTSQVAHFAFEDLCGDGHSAADYLEITKTFGSIFVSGVPQLGLETKDQARRFILFVDAAYEAKVRSPSLSFLLCSCSFSLEVGSARSRLPPSPADQALRPLRPAHCASLLGRAACRCRRHGRDLGAPALDDGRPRPVGRHRRRELDLHGRRGGVCVREGRGASRLSRSAASLESSASASASAFPNRALRRFAEGRLADGASFLQSRITEMGTVHWARSQGVAEGAQGLKGEQIEEEGVRLSAAV